MHALCALRCVKSLMHVHTIQSSASKMLAHITYTHDIVHLHRCGFTDRMDEISVIIGEPLFSTMHVFTAEHQENVCGMHAKSELRERERERSKSQPETFWLHHEIHSVCIWHTYNIIINETQTQNQIRPAPCLYDSDQYANKCTTTNYRNRNLMCWRRIWPTNPRHRCHRNPSYAWIPDTKHHRAGSCGS
jgi:hypothetical protein